MVVFFFIVKILDQALIIIITLNMSLSLIRPDVSDLDVFRLRYGLQTSQ